MNLEARSLHRHCLNSASICTVLCLIAKFGQTIEHMYCRVHTKHLTISTEQCVVCFCLKPVQAHNKVKSPHNQWPQQSWILGKYTTVHVAIYCICSFIYVCTRLHPTGIWYSHPDLSQNFVSGIQENMHKWTLCLCPWPL